MHEGAVKQRVALAKDGNGPTDVEMIGDRLAGLYAWSLRACLNAPMVALASESAAISSPYLSFP